MTELSSNLFFYLFIYSTKDDGLLPCLWDCVRWKENNNGKDTFTALTELVAPGPDKQAMPNLCYLLEQANKGECGRQL